MQNNLTTFDRNKFIPYSIGFDSLFDRLFDMDLESSSSYPPYNISKIDDNNYIIEMALAGFNKDDIEIELADSELTVRSKKRENLNKDVNLIHQGISHRSFNKKFTLSEEILVKNAEMKNGMLIIKLEKFIPENKKPKSINIK
ncbi:MAG: heat-shock protein [Pelagibacteraceae bacterium TMED124]|nr:heat-shock protein [Rickettsiales bacterium]RPG19358.1 MAG: heat-shock protein [Pelagibacteraceae bacterium TMED124]|tara:strand:+ start:1124 stop:1552 length:429 start_codon:yes stop_codon:yes gene_type:complete